jgi:hypothetical protein
MHRGTVAGQEAPRSISRAISLSVKASLAGHGSYGAGADRREGNHDDLVLALALALWHGENRVTTMIWVADHPS